MRAKTVNENIRFERGQDPRQSMGVGAIADADELDRILFQKWDGNSLDGEFKTYYYLEKDTHDYLENLSNGEFDIGKGVYQHPTRVQYKLNGDKYKKNYREIAGKALKYEDKLYIIPPELADVEWKKRF
jgi:hypothetical protein